MDSHWSLSVFHVANFVILNYSLSSQVLYPEELHKIVFDKKIKINDRCKILSSAQGVILLISMLIICEVLRNT